MISISHLQTETETRERPRQTSRPEIAYRIARTMTERLAAFRMVYRNYLRNGLIAPDNNQIHLTTYHLLASTNEFIAVSREEVIGTVSLIGDGELGLPMESIYPEPVQEYRKQGLKIGEVSCLAIQQDHSQNFMNVVVGVTRIMSQFARANGLQKLLIAVHPKHAQFYKRLMGFEQIGPKRSYPNVQNAPAVAYSLDFKKIDAERPPCYDRFFSTAIPEAELRPSPMQNPDIEFLLDLMDLSEVCVPSLC